MMLQRQESQTAILALSCNTSSPVAVWTQEAEQGFVDAEENLQEGRVCLKAVKAFASSVNSDPFSEPGSLGAGDLVQQQHKQQQQQGPVCHAHMADAILTQGGPNLQFRGACATLDELLCFDFTQNKHSNKPHNDATALQTFVVKCEVWEWF